MFLKIKPGYIFKVAYILGDQRNAIINRSGGNKQINRFGRTGTTKFCGALRNSVIYRKDFARLNKNMQCMFFSRGHTRIS